MASVMGTGPVHVFVSWGGQNVDGGLPQLGPFVIMYYGTTQAGPDITENYSHYPVHNDLTGPGISFDDGYAGREDIITLTMTRWLQAVENAIERYPRSAIAGAAPGGIPLNALGTMIVSENASFSVYLIKSGALRAANAAGGMPIGRVYWACEAMGPHKPVWGLKENMCVRVFKAKNIPTISGTALGNPGTLDLFSENPTALAPALAVAIS